MHLQHTYILQVELKNNAERIEPVLNNKVLGNTELPVLNNKARPIKAHHAAGAGMSAVANLRKARRILHTNRGNAVVEQASALRSARSLSTSGT